MKSLILFLAILLSGCYFPNVSTDEYVLCEHKYDSSMDIYVERSTDINIVEIDECPAIIKTGSGECPTMVRIINIAREEVWLTYTQFENYVCKQQ